MTNASLVNVELKENLFETDIQAHLSNIFLSFRKLQNELKKETTQELRDELYRVDQMRNDVLHIIELMNFNAVEGYKFSKMLQIILKARRKIKDRIEERQQIRSLIDVYQASFKDKLESSIKCLEQYEQKLEARTYRIRQLTELEGFNKVIAEQKKKMKIA